MTSKPGNSCPVCGGAEYTALPYGGYRFNGREMPLVECRVCLVKYIIHGMAQKDFDAFYNDPTYFDSEYAGGVELSYDENKAEMDEKARHVLSIIKKYKPAGNFLDIGCAGGFLLEVARDSYGYAVKGVEVSKEISAQGQARGLDIFNGSIYDLPIGFGSFDVVYMGDVLEHIPAPVQFMKIIKSHMNPGSVMALELPLTYNLTLSGIVIGILNMLRGKFGYVYFLPAQHRNEFVDKPPYHVLMFDRRSIKNFFARQGFEVKYLKIYEGKPKPKFSGSMYGKLKSMTHWLTLNLPQAILGDRMIVIAQKQ